MKSKSPLPNVFELDIEKFGDSGDEADGESEMEAERPTDVKMKYKKKKKDPQDLRDYLDDWKERKLASDDETGGESGKSTMPVAEGTVTREYGEGEKDYNYLFYKENGMYVEFDAGKVAFMEWRKCSHSSDDEDDKDDERNRKRLLAYHIYDWVRGGLMGMQMSVELFEKLLNQYKSLDDEAKKTWRPAKALERLYDSLPRGDDVKYFDKYVGDDMPNQTVCVYVCVSDLNHPPNPLVAASIEYVLCEQYHDALSNTL